MFSAGGQSGETLIGPAFRKAFLRGLVVVLALYALAALFVVVNSGRTLTALQGRMSEQSMTVERSFAFPEIGQTTEVSQAPVYVRGEEPLGPALPPDISVAPGEQPSASPASVVEQESPPGESSNEEQLGLRPAPIEGLTEMTSSGVLPVISPKGVTPFMAYRRPAAMPQGPAISLVVIDYGLSAQASEAMLSALPPQVSLVLSPYAADAEAWQKKAREHGHEIWIQMPMQTMNFPGDDPGPRALVTTEGLQYNQDVMNWVLSRTTGYAGIAAQTDEAFAPYAHMLESLLKSAFGRGLGFFEINPKAEPMIETLSITTGAPYARNEHYIGEISLKALENEAQGKGYAVAVVRPQPKALSALSTWIETLGSKNITLVPVSLVAASAGDKLQEPAHAP